MSSFETPSGVRYLSQLLPVGLPALSNARQFSSVNGTVFSNLNNRIIVDIQADGFLDTKQSYLKFSVRNDSGQTLKLDGSAHSLFNKVRVEGSGGEELERIDNYGVLANMMLTTQASEDQFKTNLALLAGTEWGRDISGAFFAVGSDLPAANASKTFCIPLVSGLLSNDRYIPLPFIAGPLKLELTLESLRNAFYCSNNVTPDFDKIYVENVSYVGQIINFEESFMTQFRQVLNARPIQWHGSTFRRSAANMVNAAGQAILTVNDRARSVKSTFVTFRSDATTNRIRKISHSVFPNSVNGDLSYQWRVGGKLYPNAPVRVSRANPAEAFAELQKSLGLLHNVTRSCSITPDRFISSDPSGLDVSDNITNCGSFYLAYDFENYNGQGEMESGLNTATNSLPMELVLNRSALASGVTNINVDIFLMCDTIFTLEPNGKIMAAV